LTIGSKEGDYMNLGKVGFDPVHYAGSNCVEGYCEGDTMLQFGLALQKEYDVFLTRTDGKDVDLKQRAIKAKQAGCDTFISLHTNWPKSATGIIIFYSVQRPQDKHNSVIERTFLLEEKMKVANHRIDDLEKGEEKK
jgi:N-acetylmuramoyl-L-alanine amidase